jgi:hypothetical protein
MSTLAWIVVFGLAMSALALVGGVTTLLSERALVPQITSPVVCVAPTERRAAVRERLEQTLAFGGGLAALLAIALVV